MYIGPDHWFGIVFRLVELLGVSLLLSFAFSLFALFLTSLGFYGFFLSARHSFALQIFTASLYNHYM